MIMKSVPIFYQKLVILHRRKVCIFIYITLQVLYITLLLILTFSNICEALRTDNSNINANTAEDSLTLTQRQDSVENERLFSQTLRNRYPAAQELSTSENATSTDIINDIDIAKSTSTSPVVTIDDAYNQNIHNLPRFDNDEFDDGTNLDICNILLNIKHYLCSLF